MERRDNAADAVGRKDRERVAEIGVFRDTTQVTARIASARGWSLEAISPGFFTGTSGGETLGYLMLRWAPRAGRGPSRDRNVRWTRATRGRTRGV